MKLLINFHTLKNDVQCAHIHCDINGFKAVHKKCNTLLEPTEYLHKFSRSKMLCNKKVFHDLNSHSDDSMSFFSFLFNFEIRTSSLNADIIIFLSA